MLSLVLGIAVTAVAALGMVASINSLRFGRRFRRDVQRMLADSVTPGPIDRRRLADLPAPVRRFMVKVLAPGTRSVRAIRLQHGGTFRKSLDGAPLPIRGEEYFVSDPPGFLWWGRLRIAPGVWVDACDRSLAGVGNLRVTAESTVVLGDSSGPAIDKGELFRLLGEMVLIPSAFLDGRYVSWTALDDRRARATLQVNGREVNGIFEFDENDLPTRLVADRDRDVGEGKTVSSTWWGEFGDYREMKGLTVPFRLEASWQVDGKRMPYANFVLEEFEVDPTPRTRSRLDR